MSEYPLPHGVGNAHRDPCDVCCEMANELHDIATWLADGQLTPDLFRQTVVAFEARKLARFGFTLESAVSDGPMVHFSLRLAESGELCASMDVDSHTGEIVVQRTCAQSDGPPNASAA